MQRPPGHPAAMLRVEDDPAEAGLLQAVFAAIPMRTRLEVAHDGREALVVPRHKAPDEHAPRPALIRLSLKLPGMSEQQFLAELKRDCIFWSKMSGEYDVKMSSDFGEK
jgi:CheY-like chemotaxis protein